LKIKNQQSTLKNHSSLERSSICARSTQRIAQLLHCGLQDLQIVGCPDLVKFYPQPLTLGPVLGFLVQASFPLPGCPLANRL
jgi:hypothetical protein